jgi:hypothetical protein
MKRLILVFSFYLFFSISVHCQTWPKTYPQWYGSHEESLIETYDKGYIFLLQLAIQNNKYFVVVKTDINGNVLWDKYVGNDSTFFRIGKLTNTSDNGFVLCSGVNIYDPAGSSDPFIMKFNSCGDVDWCSDINTPNIFDVGVCVRQTPQSDYILLTYGSDPNPINRIQLFKFNSSGSLLWKHNYPGDSIIFDEDPKDVKVLNDGFLITGMCFSPDSGQTGGGFERPYYVRTDTSGNEMWRLSYGRVNGYHGFPGYYTLKNQSGNFYNIGWHSNYCDTPAINECKSNGTEGYYKDVAPGACPGGNSALNWLNDSAFVVFAGGTVNGNLLLKWIKLDTLGNEKYSKIFPSGWINSTGNAVVTSDKKIAALSDQGLQIYFYKLNQDFEFDSIYSHQYLYDSLCPYPIVSDTIDPNCDLIVGINNPKQENSSSGLKVYPNPATNLVTIEFPKVLIVSIGSGKYQSTKELYQWKSTILEVFDFQGKKLIEKEIIKSQEKLEVNVSGWQSGLYYFRLVYDKQTVDGQKVLISSQ